MVWVIVVLFALVLAAVAIAVYGVGIYNGLVAVKHQVDQAWSNIDVLLRQRHQPSRIGLVVDDRTRIDRRLPGLTRS